MENEWEEYSPGDWLEGSGNIPKEKNDCMEEMKVQVRDIFGDRIQRT